ncbi:Predicted transcriptional regulator containing CBS domains [Clostridium acidisoli DSM 12555]|jgi:predicted transcriptional regulator|uniref:Predicted transcriptional regulator containing CBS domains n=1 Tax=Clostridium acidisoli DSM 12555 TaxID=1121291 RepID=A0A1W1XH91_9CLOT|nr:DRTGG domain-containing protein [Clostridium acidisoli]SMC23329.1 Predicted transcriptional regulator containing CBS domains [Clostridium acidisoli DSM 12555]
MSKHQEIINYIGTLAAGTKISVRTIAGELEVSEGTAYRAIKECENNGIVTTIPRVGTVKIDKVEKKSIEVLNYSEVLNMVDGTILGGKNGMYKTLNKFVIAAMTFNAAKKYISPGCLVIVGNREDIQKISLLNNCAVLIVGGFGCTDFIKELADEKQMPVISTSYDSFTIATMINRAISESLIKKEIILVEDIMETNVKCMKVNDTISMWRDLARATKKDKYLVLDEKQHVVGIISLKEISLENDVNDNMPILTFMNKDFMTVTPKTTVAYAAHIMGWEGIEICPVIENKKLLGIVDRQDVIKALQYALRQPQTGETLEDMVLKNFSYEHKDGKMHFKGKIVAEMLDVIGTASWSSLNMLLSTMGIMTLREKNNVNVSVDSINTYFMKPVEIDSEIEVFTNIVDMGRNFCKVEVNMFSSNESLISKLMLSAKIIKNRY